MKNKFNVKTIATHLAAVLLGLFLGAGSAWFTTLVVVILAFEIGSFAEQRYSLVARFDKLINGDKISK